MIYVRHSNIYRLYCYTGGRLLGVVKDYDLTEREKAIYTLIRKKPEISQQKVIDELSPQSMGSRMTVIKGIKNLNKIGLIKILKDKPNSQIHKLVVNEDSLFGSVTHDLDNFKETYLKLLNKSSRKINLKLEEHETFLINIISLYTTLLHTYIIQSILIWTSQIRDRDVLDKLFKLVLHRMSEIGNKISVVFKIESTVPQIDKAIIYKYLKSPLIKSFFFSHLYLDLNIMEYLTRYADKYGVEKEIEGVLDIVWKVVYPIHPIITHNMFEMGEQGTSMNDWRFALKMWREKPVRTREQIQRYFPFVSHFPQ